MRCIKFSGTLRYKLILARGPDIVLINKKKRTCSLVDFTIPTDHKENERSKKIDKNWDFARDLKKAVEHDCDTSCSWCPWNCPTKSWKRDLGNWRSKQELREFRSQHC